VTAMRNFLPMDERRREEFIAARGGACAQAGARASKPSSVNVARK